MLYAYQKSTPDLPSPGHAIPRQMRFLPTVISALGLGLVASVVWPILNYRLSQSIPADKDIKKISLISPAYYQTHAEYKSSSPKLLSDIDYTKASNWFSVTNDAVSFPAPTDQNSKGYLISIPALKINDANVSLVNDNLQENLVHYPQTALPGQKGSSVIFGHSTLPQFFDPTNYSSIFSTLPKIETGTNIFITHEGVKYTYRVSNTYEVKPDDLWVLRQEYDQKTLKLITCVPPGTKLKRLVVEAQLIKS